MISRGVIYREGAAEGWRLLRVRMQNCNAWGGGYVRQHMGSEGHRGAMQEGSSAEVQNGAEKNEGPTHLWREEPLELVQ